MKKPKPLNCKLLRKVRREVFIEMYTAYGFNFYILKGAPQQVMTTDLNVLKTILHQARLDFARSHKNKPKKIKV